MDWNISKMLYMLITCLIAGMVVQGLEDFAGLNHLAGTGLSFLTGLIIAYVFIYEIGLHD